MTIENLTLKETFGLPEKHRDALRAKLAEIIASINAVDPGAGGIYAKAATTANITLSAPQTIDGVSVIADDIVLVKNQTTAAENGVYVCKAGAWQRHAGANSATELNGLAVFVDTGTVNANRTYDQTATVATVGSDTVTFTQRPNLADLASVASGKGASLIGIQDSAGIITATDVEAALAELLDGRRVANEADVSTVGGIPLIYRTLVASGANGDTDVTLPTGHKVRVLDAWAILKGAGTAGSALTLKSTATAITNAIDVSGGGDKAIFRAGTIDDAVHEVAGAGKIRWSKASTGGDFPGAECYALVIRVA